MDQTVQILLDHFHSDTIPTICQALKLEIYTEDSTITISGIKFVLDIAHEHTTRTATLSFIDDSYGPYFRHVETYLNICLAKNDMKLFFYLLRYFSKMDNIRNASSGCKTVRTEYFNVCSCICSINSHIESFEEIVGKGCDYNLFTHQKEMICNISNFLFHFLIEESKIFFCKKLVKNVSEVKRELDDNILFYKQVNENYVYGSDECEFCIGEFVYFLDKKLSCFVVEGEKRVRSNEISFLIKKGVNLAEAVNFFMR